MQFTPDMDATLTLQTASKWTRSVVAAAAAAILVLNLIDAVFTLAYTQAGLAVEGNPLMEVVLSRTPVGFVMVKMAIVSLGVLLLWRLQRRRAAVIGMMGAATAYFCLFVYHLSEAHRLVAAV